MRVPVIRQQEPTISLSLQQKQTFMPTKKTILVTGATGAQGGSVAHALLQSG
jgi:FlaA1/EpsC-like NDP-sugar epimerase